MILNEFEYYGFKCIVRRGPLALCGYVRIPPEFPEFDSDDLVVHGGVTYDGVGLNVINIVNVGSAYRWIGFDCGHAGDALFEDDKAVKIMNRILDMCQGKDVRKAPEVFRDQEYVVIELMRLVDQLVKIWRS